MHIRQRSVERYSPVLPLVSRFYAIPLVFILPVLGILFVLPACTTFGPGKETRPETAAGSGTGRSVAAAARPGAGVAGPGDRLSSGGPARPSPGEERVFDGMRFRWIPAGRFKMGSSKEEPGRDDDEGPVHEVVVSRGFWMAEYELTQDVWKRVMKGGNPSRFTGERRPVEQVSWDDCSRFIDRLNAVSRSGGGYRLPTEAEWEYACRAGTTTSLYCGDLRIEGRFNAPALDPIAWYGGNSGTGSPSDEPSADWPEKQYPHRFAGTHDVGGKKANPWGLYDMLGNVCEWCSDFYGEDYYARSPRCDPPGPGEGAKRVLRGGSWRSDAWTCRVADRMNLSGDTALDVLGLRLVRGR